MITLPPYIRETVSYHKLPEKDRWIFNKMEICKRFGYEPYGPCGTPMPLGTYCIRPIINVMGMAKGGFWKCKVIRKGVIPKEATRPGYLWTKWETGPRQWVEYIENEVSSSQIQIAWERTTQMERYMEQSTSQAHPLPNILRGISRYMLVEYLGDVVIDIGTRHMNEEAKESVVRDYQQFDPTYTYSTEGKEKCYQPYMKRLQNKDKSYTWEVVDKYIPRRIYK